MIAHSVEAVYFGPSERQLLGCYHPPREPARARSALLCYPSGHEYVRCHRAFRRLADQLARAGFGVFRFDYLGTGDSAAESDEIELKDWVEDVALAAEHIRSRSGARALDLVGLRLGATLGMLSDADVGFDRIVLWQPVLDGARFMRELRQVHEEFLESQGPKRMLPNNEGLVEIMGTGYRESLVRELESIDLRELPIEPGRKVLVIDNAEPSSGSRDSLALETIAANLRDRGVAIRYERQPEAEIWFAEPYKQILPHASTRAIVTALVEDWT